MKKINVGIIGTGSISHFHYNAYRLLENVEITSVCDINKERVEGFAKQYDIKNVYTDYNEMLKDKEIDAVSVTAWNNVHGPASIAALKAGKHVLCEKPLALNAKEAKVMADTSKETGKLLMVGFCRRFGENAGTLKKFIEDGDFGKIYYAKTGCVRRWGNPGGWFSDRSKSGGGPVIDLGVHMIDLVRYLNGKPRAVSVMASTFNHMGMKPGIKGVGKYYSADYSEFNNVEDGASAFIKFDNGMTLVFETSWVQNIKEDRLYLELYGDKAGVSMEPEIEIYGDRNNYLSNSRLILDPEQSGFQHNFNKEIEHFIDCLGNGTQCINTADDGLEIMKILDAIYESSNTGHEVII